MFIHYDTNAPVAPCTAFERVRTDLCRCLRLPYLIYYWRIVFPPLISAPRRVEFNLDDRRPVLQATVDRYGDSQVPSAVHTAQFLIKRTQYRNLFLANQSGRQEYRSIPPGVINRLRRIVGILTADYTWGVRIRERGEENRFRDFFGAI